MCVVNNTILILLPRLGGHNIVPKHITRTKAATRKVAYLHCSLLDLSFAAELTEKGFVATYEPYMQMPVLV